MYITYKYRLLPNKTQHRQLKQILESQRILYNAALQERRDAWNYIKRRIAVLSNKEDIKKIKQAGNISMFDQFKSLTEIRKDKDYSSIPANIQRATLNRVNEAFKGFFRRTKKGNGKCGYPRFKGKAGWDSFAFHEFSGIRFVKPNRIKFDGLSGSLRLHLHRELPSLKIATAEIKRDIKGWFISLVVSIGDIHNVIDHRKARGVDMGLQHLVIADNGKKIPDPKIGKHLAKAMKKQQRKLSRCKKGSNNRLK